MSHNLDMKTSMIDPEAIARAFTHLGFSAAAIKIHKTPVTMRNWKGETMPQKANVIVNYQDVSRVGDYPSNDIGFERGADGVYKCHMDDGFLTRHTEFMNKLGTYYNYEKSKMELDARKVQYEETMDKLGRLQLKVAFKAKKSQQRITL